LIRSKKNGDNAGHRVAQYRAQYQEKHRRVTTSKFRLDNHGPTPHSLQHSLLPRRNAGSINHKATHDAHRQTPLPHIAHGFIWTQQHYSLPAAELRRRRTDGRLRRLGVLVPGLIHGDVSMAMRQLSWYSIYQGRIFQRWLSPSLHFQSTISVPSCTPPWALSPWKASKLR
jgi:hypothetical protein